MYMSKNPYILKTAILINIERPINYSFKFSLITHTGLVGMWKIQKNVYSKMRPVGLINIQII